MLQAKNVSKHYDTPAGPLPILRDVTLSLGAGDAVSIIGPSGTGKSTLLYVFGALEPPSSGEVTLDGQNPYTLDDKALSSFRNKQVGFVFQDHCLLPQLTVLENVLIPTIVSADKAGVTERAKELLEAVGLSHRLDHRPAELSGGEKQRVAIARALITKPKLMLCDEPTGNLDRASAESAGDLLLRLNAEQKTILIVVTHSLELADRFPRKFELRDQNIHPL
ncbi:MAG: ABC transporter ATP-binding protein [Bryobacteraceae bacterium]